MRTDTQDLCASLSGYPYEFDYLKIKVELYFDYKKGANLSIRKASVVWTPHRRNF